MFFYLFFNLVFKIWCVIERLLTVKCKYLLYGKILFNNKIAVRRVIRKGDGWNVRIIGDKSFLIAPILASRTVLTRWLKIDSRHLFWVNFCGVCGAKMVKINNVVYIPVRKNLFYIKKLNGGVRESNWILHAVNLLHFRSTFSDYNPRRTATNWYIINLKFMRQTLVVRTLI